MKTLLAICAVAISCLASPSASAQTSYTYAQVTGFDSLADDTPASFTFRTPADLTITRTGALGNGLTASTNSVTFANTNPAWIAGTRAFYQLAFDEANGAGSTASYGFNFSVPLPASGYLIFVDLDVDEQVRIRAYDAGDNLIPFSSFTFVKQDGNDAGGTPADYVAWTDVTPGTYSGQLANIAYRNPGDNPVVTLQSSVPIKRLVYDFDMDPNASVFNNSIRFNFIDVQQAQAQSIPTLSPWGMAVLFSLLGLSTILILRRRGR